MNVKRITQLALLITMALIIFIVELRIPNLVPIPGVKLGLANIVTVYAMYQFTARETMMIVFARILLGSIFGGNISAIFYSLDGAMLCLAGMLLLRRVIDEKYIWIFAVGKTSQVLSPRTEKKISGASLKNFAKSKTQQYLFLNLRSGQRQEKLWEIISLSHGEQSMLITGIRPREECVSTLSQILQAQVPQKYYLSPRECLDILRRASERGKKLPEVLRIALERQAAQG